MAKRTRHTIDQALYEQVKGLEAYNITPKVISQITQLSSASVQRIKQTSSWEDFLEQRAKLSAQTYQTKKNGASSASAEKVLEMPVLSLAEREVAAVERQAAALERMADAWEAAPTRKGIFRG